MRMNKKNGTVSKLLVGLAVTVALGFGATRTPEDGQETVVLENSLVAETIENSAQAETGNQDASAVESPSTSDTNISEMEIHFIDVEQGDATLIKVDDHYMLIDAGDNSMGTKVQLYLTKQGVKKLDYLILTHTDADHIGGADVVVTKFDIDTIFMGDYKKDNKTYNELIEAMKYKSLTHAIPEVGAQYQLGDATFTILGPKEVYDDPNNTSIALKLTHGENTFLFSGDAEAEAEADILDTGLDLDVDVYHAGHHGSSTSSTTEFLDAMTPEYAVISCKEGNSYGHPHAETLINFRAKGIQVFRTDEQGSVVAFSDGENITWNCAPSETWQAGERGK